ncbi:PQQ-dependent sugar dehydrogenase [Nocardia sp. NPDC051030]|uniref:PQQ-dependent sugar dehydrogenase n=1 Tax=Nocardia sp. NPDC051030 TaxID=3155162 RepID=UPI0034233A43
MGSMRNLWLRTAPVLCLALSLAAGCDSDTGSPPTPRVVVTATAPSSPNGVPDLGTAEEIAQGLDVPWGLVFLPDGSALVAQRDSGVILRITPGAEPEQVYRVPGVSAAGEGGLLGIAISPTYTDDHYVYAYFTAASDNRIVRFKFDGDPEVIYSGIAKASTHDGGRIAFGPDGMLYAGTGDAGQGARSQDPASPNGKILRLTPEGAPAPGNPTPGSPVYSLGHRNVQGLAWDRAGRLFAAEFGRNDFDEINRIEPGHDYGWPDVEGMGDTKGGQYTNPVVVWKPADASPSAIAIAGDTLYVAALRGTKLWTVPLHDGATGEPRAALVNTYGRLRTVVTAPDGALWVTTSNTDGRGDPRPNDDRIIRFPAR